MNEYVTMTLHFNAHVYSYPAAQACNQQKLNMEPALISVFSLTCSASSTTSSSTSPSSVISCVCHKDSTLADPSSAFGPQPRTSAALGSSRHNTFPVSANRSCFGLLPGNRGSLQTAPGDKQLLEGLSDRMSPTDLTVL